MCNNYDRRNFLKMMGATGALSSSFALKSFIGLVVNSLTSTVQAQEAMKAHKKYVLINFPGGAPRWMFDLLLAPNGTSDENYRQNPFLATKFSSTDSSSNIITPDKLRYDYSLVQRKGLWVPYLWSQTIPSINSTGSLSSTPMENLLDNALFVRGNYLTTVGHGEANRSQVQPGLSGASVNGLAADASGLPAVSLSPVPPLQEGYFSPKQTPNTFLGGDNPIEEMLAPFDSQLVSSYRKVASVKEAVDSALLEFSKEYVQSNPFASMAGKSREHAEKLIRDGISDALVEYGRLEEKYNKLVSQSLLERNMPGIDDKAIITGGDQDFRFIFTEEVVDVGGVLRVDTNYQRGLDARDCIGERTIINRLARNFAATEYILKNNLSSSIGFACGYVQDCFLPNGRGGEVRKMVSGDPHSIGSFYQNYLFTKNFKAFASCMNELIGQLKTLPGSAGGSNLYNDTVIHLAGDFARTPRADHSGSDHGFRANHISVFSGMIDGAMSLGNIYDQSPRPEQRSTNPGTWGFGAPVPELDNKPISIGNVTSTVSELLGTQYPQPNAAPLVRVQGGRVIPLIESAKNIKA